MSQEPGTYDGGPGTVPPRVLLNRDLQTRPELLKRVVDAAPPQHRQWLTAGWLSREQRRELLIDFLRVQGESEVWGFVIRWSIAPPKSSGADLPTKFLEWQKSLKPVLHKVLLRELLDEHEISLLLKDAQPLVRQVAKGQGFYRAWDFGTTRGLFCQIALEVYQSKDLSLPSIRFCPVCGCPFPVERRSNARGCSPECSKELKRRLDRDRYHRKKFAPYSF